MGALGFFFWLWATTESKPVAARSSLSQPQASPTTASATAAYELAASRSSFADALPATLNAAVKLQEALRGAPTEQQDTAARLLAFARTGNLAALEDVSREQTMALAAHLLETLGAGHVEHLLTTNLRLPPGLLTSHPRPAAAAADLLDAVKGVGDHAAARGLVFTDRCEANGAVTGNVHVIPSGTRRVYAAFENAGSLHGLDRVFAVWRNPADARMVFAEYEPVHAGSSFNYVWLELKDGWPAGHYEVSLYHPQRPAELLASRGFNVR